MSKLKITSNQVYVLLQSGDDTKNELVYFSFWWKFAQQIMLFKRLLMNPLVM